MFNENNITQQLKRNILYRIFSVKVQRATKKQLFTFILLTSSIEIHADIAPKPVLLISKGTIVCGCFKKINIQYFLSLNKKIESLYQLLF